MKKVRITNVMVEKWVIEIDVKESVSFDNAVWYLPSMYWNCMLRIKFSSLAKGFLAVLRSC